ncbi:MAG: hypothetical protein WHT81_09025, partial [Rectinemataceae bacterium]
MHDSLNEWLANVSIGTTAEHAERRAIYSYDLVIFYEDGPCQAVVEEKLTVGSHFSKRRCISPALGAYGEHMRHPLQDCNNIIIPACR